jgi:sRNA-binding protein
MTPAACAAQLKQLFPALFAGAPKPVKLRIQADIQERAPGVFTKQVLSAFLRRHTGSHAYLLALTKAKERFDLDGQPSGELSEEHRKVAADELARRRENTESRVALEQQQRRNRATLLRDFQTTTLTPANFCALKGVPVDELDKLLDIARQEAQEAPPPERRPDRRHDGRPDSRPAARPDGRPGQPHKRR